ncbi:MAG: translation initiation factor IF-2 subunit beta [Candidatus Woesearchaeota archaeon]|nr:translation initiation factor IF-2 subunit beta [Candidatus Woesearchaeota archaeon]
MDYEDMLERARKNIPESLLKSERFEIPKVVGHIQGNRTVISNFYAIATTLRREPEHLLKFVLRELATPGEITSSSFIIGRKISAEMINQKIEQYAQTFVICRECKRPDTSIIKEKEATFLKCQACGARYPVETLK